MRIGESKMKNWVILFLVTAIILSGCMQPAEVPEEPQPVEEPVPMPEPTPTVPPAPTPTPSVPEVPPTVPTGPEMQEQIDEEQEEIGPIDYTEDVYFPPVGTEKTTSTTNSSTRSSRDFRQKQKESSARTTGLEMCANWKMSSNGPFCFPKAH